VKEIRSCVLEIVVMLSLGGTSSVYSSANTALANNSALRINLHDSEVFLRKLGAVMKVTVRLRTELGDKSYRSLCPVVGNHFVIPLSR
jgi:hypothetical protein